MKQGKFEAGRKAAPTSEETGKRRPDWLLVLVPLLVLAALAAILLLSHSRSEPESTSEPVGLSRQETMNLYRWIGSQIQQQDMILTLLPEEGETEREPIRLVIPPAKSQAGIDLKGLETDLDADVGRVSRGRYQVDPSRYLSLDRKALRALAEQAEEEYRQPFLESFSSLRTVPIGQEEAHVLVVNQGREGREISADAIYEALVEAYQNGDLNPVLRYRLQSPKPLDLEAIHKELCIPPVDAVLDEKTFAITPEISGYGFEPQELETLLENTEPGKACSLTLHPVQPEITAADIEASLYAETIAEANTPHSWINDRTHNLELACAAINGTVVMPGEIFSFNETVGERTAEKGYREATVYGAGGASVPELGGGVCQVASSIYYAVLQADLETVERSSHMYLVTYVPRGMDAAIYWGMLDYKFRNSSPYPIKIEANVSDGMVHIFLKGTEWKDYTVRLSYDTLEEVPYETTYRYVYDGSAAPGETLVTPYTGYLIATYRTVVDKDGNVVETTRISTSRYRKRDKVIAALPPATEPSEPDED